MKRPASSENVLKRIAAWRQICPELVIRSTFITGFPGETEADFQELLGFLEAAQLDRVGAFAYSSVDGATANELPDPVPEEERESRRVRLMQFQSDISAEKLAQRIGNEEVIVLDDVDEEGAIGRSWREAPDIDGVIQVMGFTDCAPGDRLAVRIVDADEHDLYAEPLSARSVN